MLRYARQDNAGLKPYTECLTAYVLLSYFASYESAFTSLKVTHNTKRIDIYVLHKLNDSLFERTRRVSGTKMLLTVTKIKAKNRPDKSYRKMVV